MHQNSLANLQPRKNWTKEEAGNYGRIGGSRKTASKTKALLVLNLSKRKCVTCPYFDICYVGQEQVGNKDFGKNDLKKAMDVRCQLSPWTMRVLSEINALEDFNQLMKVMLARLLLGVDDSDKIYKFSKLLSDVLKSKEKFQAAKSKEKKDVKIEVVIVDPKNDNRDKEEL